MNLNTKKNRIQNLNKEGENLRHIRYKKYCSNRIKTKAKKRKEKKTTIICRGY